MFHLKIATDTIANEIVIDSTVELAKLIEIFYTLLH